MVLCAWPIYYCKTYHKYPPCAEPTCKKARPNFPNCHTRTTVEMQDARWDRMTGISNTLQFFHISSELSIRAYSREHRKRKDRPTTKDYKSSMVREWTCPSCIGDVCSYCQKKRPCNARGTKKCSVVLQCAMPLPTMCCWLRQGPPKNG